MDINKVAIIIALIIAIFIDVAGDWYLDQAADMITELNNGIRMASNGK